MIRKAPLKMNRCFAAGLALLFSDSFVSSASAQTLPAPNLSLAQTSSSDFDWGFNTGFDYVSGKYGAKCALASVSLSCNSTGTTVFVIPASAMLQIQRLRLGVTVPYVDIEGPGHFSGNMGIPVIVAPATTDPKRRSGLGDITLDSAFILHREDILLPRIEIAGAIKLPSAGVGLGTGKTDFSAGVNLYRMLAPNLTAFGSLSYQWVGDNNTIKLYSGAHATAGADFKFFSLGLGGIFDYRQSAWSGASDYFTFDPYITWRMSGGLGISLYTMIGLTHSSPSQGIGARLTL